MPLFISKKTLQMEFKMTVFPSRPHPRCLPLCQHPRMSDFPVHCVLLCKKCLMSVYTVQNGATCLKLLECWLICFESF